MNSGAFRIVGVERALDGHEYPRRYRSVMAFRRIANAIRGRLYFALRAPWVKRDGFVRIPWSVLIQSPHRDVSLGHRVQFGPGCLVQCDVRIGNDVLIAAQVALVGRDDHRFDCIGLSIWDSPRGDSKKLVIEDDVWIGHGAVCIAGITIGTGSIVAAGAVVTKDVPPYSIVGGNPATVLRPRFNEENLRRHLILVARKAR